MHPFFSSHSIRSEAEVRIHRATAFVSRSAFYRGKCTAVNTSHLTAPLHTAECDPPHEGRIQPKPWDYRVTAAIPHLNTIEPLKMCVRLLLAQTERPYILIVDTGSSSEALKELEAMRSETSRSISFPRTPTAIPANRSLQLWIWLNHSAAASVFFTPTAIAFCGGLTSSLISSRCADPLRRW